MTTPLPEVLDAAVALRRSVALGFEGHGPALALALVGVAAWLRWALLGVRRMLAD